MDFSSFFLMGGSLARISMHLDIAESISRSEELAYSNGSLQPPRPLRFGVQSGSFRGDWLDSTLVSLSVVSLRLVELLVEKSFTGWSTYPVEITGHNGRPIEGYEGFAVTGRCGPPDAGRSQKTIRPPISPNGNAYAVRVGLCFEESSWDGSDIFRPDGTSFVICTDAVRRCLTKAKMKNLEFEPLAEFEMLI